MTDPHDRTATDRRPLRRALAEWARAVTEARWFGVTVFALILANAALLVVDDCTRPVGRRMMTADLRILHPCDTEHAQAVRRQTRAMRELNAKAFPESEAGEDEPRPAQRHCRRSTPRSASQRPRHFPGSRFLRRMDPHR